MAKALGLNPAEAQAPSIDKLAAYISGTVGLIFTNRDPVALLDYLGSFSAADFARSGAVASRDFIIPPGVLYSTGGQVAPEDDVLLGHTIEPELRKLGMPTRMLKGKVVLDGAPEDAKQPSKQAGYVVCRAGDVLDSRQTRLLKLFDNCMSEFRIRVLA